MLICSFIITPAATPVFLRREYLKPAPVIPVNPVIPDNPIQFSSLQEAIDSWNEEERLKAKILAIEQKERLNERILAIEKTWREMGIIRSNKVIKRERNRLEKEKRLQNEIFLKFLEIKRLEEEQRLKRLEEKRRLKKSKRRR